MSSNNQRSIRRGTSTRQTRHTTSSTTAASNDEVLTTARRPRTCVRSVASDKKAYFVDSDDENDLKETTASTSKRTKITNGTTSESNGKTSATNGHSKVNFEQVEKLEMITGLGRAEATELMQACDNSLEKAIEIHFSGGAADISSKTNGKSANKRTHKEIDCEGFSVVSDDSNSQSSVKYDNDDGVRAPIAPTFARLCDYDPYAVEFPSHKRSRVDGFRNMREEFNDSLATGSSRAKNFSTLFRPPIDLLYNGSFEASKVRACKVNKWVMLNVQSNDDFACKCLNRDLWSDETVKEIIKANFVFNQVYYDSVEGQKLINIYNIHTYPFIGIIDPRTGEKLIQLQSNKLDSCSFCEKITNFLCDFEMPNNEDDTNVPSNECLKVDDDDEVVVLDKQSNSSDESTKLTNGHTAIQKPKRAQDILNSNDGIFDSEEDDNIKDLNDSYEDDSVISKEKYDKQKLAEKARSNTESVFTAQPITENKLEKSDEIEKKQIHSEIKSKEVHQPQVFKYTTPGNDKKDCTLRVSYPNGDRLDFSTNGECKLKYLTEYLIKDGFRLDTHELIERLMPKFMPSKPKLENSEENGSILDFTDQSRNLFHKNPNLTFKELNLYPRVALLLQES